MVVGSSSTINSVAVCGFRARRATLTMLGGVAIPLALTMLSPLPAMLRQFKKDWTGLTSIGQAITLVERDGKAYIAVALADSNVNSSFLTLFGRSARVTGMENERVNELAPTQWLLMLNSATIQRKLQSGPKLLAMINAGGTPKEIAERLYLTILSRFPTEADVRAAEEHAKSGVAKGRDVWVDLAWALINSPEFLLRH